MQYRVAGRSARWSLQRAVDGDATAAELRILAAVHHWTTTYSRLEDWLTLGQIAVVAGLWDGRAKECPRVITKNIARRLKALRDKGAVVYEPSIAEGPGHRSRIGVPLADRGLREPPMFGGPAAPKGVETAPQRGLSEPREGGCDNPPPEKEAGKVIQNGVSPAHASGLEADGEASAEERVEAFAELLAEMLDRAPDDALCLGVADVLVTALGLDQVTTTSRWVIEHQDLLHQHGPSAVLAYAAAEFDLELAVEDLP